MDQNRKSLNLNLRSLKPSATVAINEHCNALLAEGKTVYKLGLGQSPFPVPDIVVKALQDNAFQKDYLPVKGLRPLREMVAQYHSNREGIGCTAEGVLIGPGSKELMFLLQLAFYGELVIPAPSWVSYAPQAQIIGRNVRFVQTQREDGWRLTASGLEELCLRDPDRPRVLILNYPNNPTGGTYSESELKDLAEVSRRFGIILLSDEIYGEVQHDGKHVSIARFYPEGTIISGGISKWCGAGGWRLGTFVFPKELHWLLDSMATAASETYTSTSAPIQYASIAAYTPSPEIEEYLRHSRRVLGVCGNWVAERLRASAIHCPQPAGGFYVFPDLSGHSEKLAKRGIHTSEELCTRLLSETGVALLPGSDFGRPLSELTVRVAYVNFDGSLALKAAAQVSGDLDESFLRAHCDKVCIAIDALCHWASR
ncbi:MAG: aminotransferase class I/II-fold pyridoxal phosphate-dependent enzyme [Kofleriaceae bacterium]|nr:aminotransferase class I/II-fold pyridoxal phosphate-dependent enzyme [Kofleriaceae bacterium]